MTRTVVITAGTHARLCEIAAAMRRETGKAVSFAEVVESLLEGWPCR